MASPRTLESITRRVLFAVELIDPVTGERVSSGLDIQPLDAAGAPINDAPIRNFSGRFVWLLQRGNAWPAQLQITPRKGQPYLAQTVATPIPPSNLANPLSPAADPEAEDGQPLALAPERRLITVVLALAPTYAFEGVTAVSGAVREAALGSAAVRGAVVQLAWKNGNAPWTPQPHGPNAPLLPGEALTDEHGAFAVFAPVGDPHGPDPNLKGEVLIRLQVTRAGPPLQTRATPLNSQSPSLPDSGLIREGRLLPAEVQLRWDQLV